MQLVKVRSSIAAKEICASVLLWQSGYLGYVTLFLLERL
jgi:hypothetical protein